MDRKLQEDMEASTSDFGIIFTRPRQKTFQKMLNSRTKVIFLYVDMIMMRLAI